jgi:hypothetical protein
VVVPDGSLQVVGAYFNVTAIPAAVVWPAGPKRMGKGFRLEHEVLASMLGRGYKAFFHSLRMFLATAVASPLRARGVADFMTKGAPLLPRVVLLSEKAAGTSTLSALSTAFASRGVFGQAAVSDANLSAAFGAPAPPALLVSPPGPHMPPPASGALEPGSFAGWTRFTPTGANGTYAAMHAFLSRALPHAPVPVLTDPPSYRIHCGDRTDVTVCFIAVLPPDELAALQRLQAGEAADDDAAASADEDGNGGAGRPDDDPRPAATLRRLASRSYVRMDWEDLQRGREVAALRLPLAFAAVDAEEQATFAANLKASGPGLIALNPRKKVFTVYKGEAFSEASLYGFVLAVMDKAMAVPGEAEAASAAYGASVEPLPEHVISLDKLADVPQLRAQAPPKPAARTAGKKKAGAGGKKKGKKGGAKKGGGKKAAAAAGAAADGEDGGKGKGEL